MSAHKLNCETYKRISKAIQQDKPVRLKRVMAEQRSRSRDVDDTPKSMAGRWWRKRSHEKPNPTACHAEANQEPKLDSPCHGERSFLDSIDAAQAATKQVTSRHECIH